MKIFVSGSLAYDIILDYPGKFSDHIKAGKEHVLSLSFLVRSVKKSVGGTAGNIAYNLAMLGIKSVILGAVGYDGQEILERYKNMSIDIKGIQVSKLPTAAAYIMTDSVDNQIAGFYPGAMMEKIKYPNLPLSKKATIARSWAIIAAENPDNMVRLVKYYQMHQVKYIFDPGQQITSLSKFQLLRCIRGASILIGNDYEIDYLSKKTSKKNFDLVVIRTLGPKGSEIVYPNGKKIKIGTAKVRLAVDPTGAGDAYRAGLICGVVKGFDLKTSGELGATAASFAVEKYGTQNHRFNYDILVKRHNKNFKRKI